MKKHLSYLVLSFTLLLSGAMQAKVNHYVGFYAQGGEWSLMPRESSYKPSLGAEGGLGLLYELQSGSAYRSSRFLFDIGVGANYGFTAYNISTNQTQTLSNQSDLDGQTFDYVYEINDRKDQYTNLMVQVPILFGGQWGRFYMLAGVKAGLSMMTTSFTKAQLTTYGVYNQFDNFCNMPEYEFFDDLNISKAHKTNFNFNLDVSLELGGRVGVLTEASGYDVPKRKIEYRIAGFVDYGVLDLHKANTLEALTVPSTYDAEKVYDEGTENPTNYMVDNMTANDIMSTSNFAKAVNNLVVGIKFTMLFQLPEPGKCVICQDAYRTSIHPRNGGLKYEE